MQFRSITRRSMSALATSALAAGALTVPVALMATPAQAASGPIAYTCNLQMTGGFATYGGDRQATLTFDTDAADEATVGTSSTPTLTATLTFDPAYAQLFAQSPVNRMGGSLTAATTTNGTAGTAPIAFTQWDRGGGSGTPISSISLTGTGPWGEISAAEAGDIGLGVGTLTGTLYMGTTFNPNANTSVPTTCTPNNAPVAAVDTITAVPAPVIKDLALTCTFSGTSFAYNTDLSLAAQTKKSGKILVTAGLVDDMPNTAPSFVTASDQNFVATLGTATGDLVGSRIGEFHGGTAVAIPAVSGLLPGSGSTLAVTVEDFSLAVGTLATIPCTLDEPETFTIDAAPKTPVCVTAEAAYPTAQTGVATATTSASAAAAAVTAASGKAGTASAAVNAATASVKKADASVKKAAASVKKATKAAKKAKKAKKAKAKKALTKAKKAQSSAKKAQSSAKKALVAANGTLAAANGELAAAQGKATTANSQLAAAKATLAAAQTAYDAC